MAARCITISVKAEAHIGGRKKLEDYLVVKLSPEQGYIGVFDGHGGKEAAKCARDRLWDIIQSQPKYRLSDLASVKESLEEAFVALHSEMEPQRVTWKSSIAGYLSTAGTTATVIIFKNDNIYIANVGDSTAIMARSNPLHVAGQPEEHPVKAVVLTKDHKPDDPQEISNIANLGGKVMISRKGVPRVVWSRPNKFGVMEEIPFLGVSRSLGDFWSYNPITNQFTVSPRPDVHVHPLDSNQKFVVIGSDGLWSVMSPDEVVRFIWDYEHDQEVCHQPRDVVRAIINEALRRWAAKRQPADNIAVLIAFLTEAVVPAPGSPAYEQSAEPVADGEEASSAPDVSPSSETAVSASPDSPPASPSLLGQSPSTLNSTLCIGKHRRTEDASPEPSAKR